MFPFFNLSFFSLVPFLIIFLILIPLKRHSSASKTHKTLPPSPSKFPIIGNLHQLGTLPHRFFHALSQKHGPLMMIQLGSVPVLIASSAEAAQEILKTHDLVFCNRPRLSIPNALTYGSKDIAFSPYGEQWRQMKSIVVLELLSHKQVKLFRRVREEESRFMFDMIEKSCGSSIDLAELIISLTNNIVCRVALGKTYRGLKFKNLMRKIENLLGVFSVGSYIPWLSWVDRLSGLDGKLKKVAKELDELFEIVIEEHVHNNKQMDSEKRDLIDILLDVQRESTTTFTFDKDVIKAVIFDMFVGGTDTTSSATEWAISELIKHPRVMKKVRQEVAEVAQGRSLVTEDDLEKMPYLQAVLKESMRLHPPAPLLIPRESSHDVKVMGYDIASGTRVLVNEFAIARDPSKWEDPEEFKPERFLNSPIDYKGFHFDLLPFGAGRRGCPGIQFALAIYKLATANLVHRYDFGLPDGKRAEELDMSEITSGLGLRRISPLLVVATPRF